MKTCPFCGNIDLSVAIGCSYFACSYFVSCTECGTEGPSGNTEHKAIEKWNKRVPPPPKGRGNKPKG